MPARVRLAVYSDSREFAGAEMSLETLLAALGRHVDVTVLGIRQRVVERLAAARPGSEGVVVRQATGKTDLGGIRAHLGAVRRVRADIFVANLRTSWSCQYGLLAALLTRGTRIVAVEHAPLRPAVALQRGLKRVMSRRLAAHVAASDHSARTVEGLAGLAPGSVRTIYNGVPDLPLGDPPRSFGRPAVGAVGRLVREKGFDVLVRALPELPGATAVLVGDGPERGPLERLAAELGVGDRLVVTGWEREPRRLLPAFDILAAPSRFEGFGIAIVEAMLAERAVVASRVGGIPEVVADGETGVLVPAGDPAALAGALRGLLDDPERRRRLGERGRGEALERFAPATAARAFEALFDEIL